MEHIPLPRSPLFYDHLTGLPTVLGWMRALAGGVFSEPGGLIACAIANITHVDQAYGYAAGDLLLCEVITRLQQALPENALIIRGAGNQLFCWLPGMHGRLLDAFVSHLSRMACLHSLLLPGARLLTPRLRVSSRAVVGDASAWDVLRELEQDVRRQAESSALLTVQPEEISAREDLEQRFHPLYLFGREPLLQQILRALKLPSRQPCLVTVLGPPHADKAHLLSGVGLLLSGQHLPLAEVYCRPRDQAVPYALLTALVYRFMSAFPTTHPRQRLQDICRTYPWVAGMFPELRARDLPPPPEDGSARYAGQAVLLLELARTIPHIALVHNAHLADTESLQALAELQALPQHGLRIIAGVDPAGETGEIPEQVRELAALGEVMRVPPFTQDAVYTYLRTLIGERVEPSVGAMLFRASDGWPLLMTEVLRTWVDSGVLARILGRWIFYPAESTSPADDLGLSLQDRLRLGEAALAIPTTVNFLATLWRTTDGDARITVERARALGYLRGIDARNAELVQFADVEHASRLLELLSPEQLAAARAAIAQLQRTGPDRVCPSPMTPPAIDVAPPAWHDAASPRPAPPPATAVPGADPVVLTGPDDMPELLHAASALRFAGVQSVLYPPESKIARESLAEALNALAALLMRIPRLTLRFGDLMVTFGGQPFREREIGIVVKDLRSWMMQQEVYGIDFTPGLTADELSRFLQFWCAPAPSLKSLPAARLAALQLHTISVITQEAFLAREHTAPVTGVGAHPKDNLTPAKTPGAAPAFLEELLGSGYSTLLAGHAAPDLEVWKMIPQVLADAPVTARQQFFTDLSYWLSEQHPAIDPRVMAQIDALLTVFAQRENDLRTLYGISVSMEARLLELLEARDVAGVLAMLDVIAHRAAEDPSEEVPRFLSALLDRIGANCTFLSFFEEMALQPDAVAKMHGIVELLGARAIRPLIDALKEAEVMQERIRLIHLLREFGSTHYGPLLQELHAANPWYVYRNLLQVLAEIGTEEALGVVVEKIKHSDPRVRAEAVSAAVRIARQKATPYLLQGLEDHQTEVRARAAAVAGLCTQPRIQERILQLLQNTEEAENVQLSACLALGQFTTETARETLLQILTPQIFSPYRKMSDDIRSAAVVALDGHFEHPAVQAALQHALHDRSTLVSQTAQRIWQQHQVTSEQ